MNKKPTDVLSGMNTNKNVSEKFKIIRVYYGTNRKPLSNFEDYGIKRGKDIRYGLADISIPHSHEMGVIEEPFFFFRENPEEHIVILGTHGLLKNEYFTHIRNQLKNSDSKSALLFIHGYNVSFEAAAKRTAQMSYDLNFKGVPLFFSWPSDNETLAYAKDEADIEWSKPYLTKFLKDILENEEISDLYLIGHSMGTRALVKSVISSIESSSNKNKLKQLILAAPDIDAGIFIEQIAPELKRLGIPTTLYASSRDKALMLSKTFHDQQRIGEGGENMIVMDGINSIDASAVKSSFLGHSYYADNRSVISDIYYILQGVYDPNNRVGLLRNNTNRNEYFWYFKP
jgi:esterase/lipase superfamily enzyme